MALDRAAMMSLAIDALSRQTESNSANLMRTLSDLFGTVATLIDEHPMSAPVQIAPSPDQPVAVSNDGASDEWLTIAQALVHIQERVGRTIHKDVLRRRLKGYNANGKHYPPKFVKGVDARTTSENQWLIHRSALDGFIASSEFLRLRTYVQPTTTN